MILRGWFGATEDERVVLSVCAVPDGDGCRVVHGSLLVVPERCAQIGWAAWKREHEYLGPDVGPLPPELHVTGPGWLRAGPCSGSTRRRHGCGE